MDVFIISALIDELEATIVDGRVQDVIDVDERSIGLEIYAGGRRHYLVLSADSASPRAHLAASKLRRGVAKPTQLGLLCRRYIEGAIVTQVSQPAWERALELVVDGPAGTFRLIAELMPRRANVLLVKDGIIHDCLKRVGPQENRYRLSLPNHKYVPPPPMNNQADPALLTEAELQNILESADDPSVQTRRVLPRKILGIGPLIAREIVFRASGDIRSSVDSADSADLFTAMQQVLTPLRDRRWRPGIGSIDGVPSEYSVFPLTYLDWRDCDSISAAISQYYGALEGIDAYKEAKKPVAAALAEAEARVSAKLESMRAGLRDASELDRLRQSGELILAYQYALDEDQTELRAQYDIEAPTLVIKLDPSRSPLENAQDYFRKYEKAKAARESVPALIAATELELGYLAQLNVDLETAGNWPEIDDVTQALQMRGLWRGKQGQRVGGGGRRGPLRVVSRDGYLVWIGRNSRQNEIVTFKTANAQDIWLHARNVPGAHVIIRNDGRRITESLIAEAAAVAAWYSSLRLEARVQVDYTRVRHVRSIKGAGPGMVTYRNESSLSVKPADESVLG